MIGQVLVLGVLPIFLAMGALWDVATFKIPNFVSLSLLIAFFLYVLTVRMPLAGLGVHLLVGAIGLTIGFFLFALGYVGGGDAKFLATILLWIGGGHDAIDYALIASIAGGALTLLLISIRSLPLPSMLAGQAWISRLHDTKSGVPYGVALATGALLVLPYTEMFHAICV
jgi:prepilin peptidase CpaA